MKQKKKQIFSFFLAFAVLLSSLGIQNINVKAADTNVASGKNVTVSSVENQLPGNVGGNVVDGNSDTRWSSNAMKGSGANDSTTQTAQWLTIDLESERTNASEIRVAFFMKVWAAKYRIETAASVDATEWTLVKDIEQRNMGSLPDNHIDIFAGTYELQRYVRFYFDKVNPSAGGTGVSIREITIMGTPVVEEPTNVALGKTARASSVESALPENVAGNAFDGSADTRWSSNAMKASGANDDTVQTPQWLMVDLEAEATKATEISVSFFRKVWAAKYRIETAATSDATEWTLVKDIPQRTKGSLSDDHVDTFSKEFTLQRYVRFYFEKVNPDAGGTGVSVKNITIMGRQTGVITPGTPQEPEDELVPTYSRNFTDGNVDGVEMLYGSGATITGSSNGMNLTYTSTRAGVVDKNMTPVSDAIYEATIVPNENGARFGLIMRATDANHKVLVGTENSNNKWFWEFWGDSGNSWGSTVTGPALTVGKETKIKVELVGKKVTLWVDGTQVFSQTMSGTPHMANGYFGFDKTNSAGNYTIKEMKVTAINSASSILHGINSLPTIGLDTTKVELPEVEEGYNIKIIGSNKEQVISNDGDITSHNIGDRNVKLLVEVTNNEDEADTARRNFDVVVPSKNSKYPEIFKTVIDANEKPVIIPSIQEWYGYNGTFTLNSNSKIIINDVANVGLRSVAENMQTDLEEITGLTIPIVIGTEGGSNDIYIESLNEDTYGVGDEGYFMTVDEEGIKIYAHTYTGSLYGTITVEQILWRDDANKNVPYGVVRDYPDYEIRGVMFDVGRIPHRLQYLQDYTKILTWYKMSEFHLHLNDDFEYNKDGLSTKTNTTWSGLHRLESDVYPSLTAKDIYTGEAFEYFNNDYADPFYTKEEYRQLEDLANSRGIDLIAEFDTPSHSTAYIEYANENPDNIEWLGPINTTVSSASNNREMLALDVNSSNQVEKQHAINARRFIEELYGDYLGGSNPVFKSDTVHVGADEYWDKSNPEAFRQYINFLSELMASYGKTARMWGAQKLFPGTTVIDPANIVIDIWATYEDDPYARLAEGYQVVNVPQPYLYTTPGRDHKDMIGEEYLYKNWDPTIFNGDIRAEAGEPLLLGAKAALWGDEFREGITEADLHERMLRSAAMVAEKTWGGQSEEDSYIEYQKAFEDLEEGPGTKIAHTIISESEVVVDYDLQETINSNSNIVVKDASGNGYDAVVENGKIVDVDGTKMIKFDGTTKMTTPLETLGYPYTVSFDVKASDGNNKDSLLFSGYDGQLLAKGISNSSMTVRRSFYTQPTGFELPTDDTANVTIVGTFQNTKIYVDGVLVKMLYSADDGNSSNYWSTFVFPMKEIGLNFHGYMGNIKAYNKALQPEMIRNAADMTEINVALNTEAYAERFGGSPALNSGDLKRHPAWKATDGDKNDLASTIISTDPNSYWLSSNNNNDYLMVDLDEVKDISKVVITWNGAQYATSFRIETSIDGKNWTTVETISGNTASENTITLATPVEAQYVKVQGITSNTNYYGIREVEVFEKVDKSPLKVEIADVKTVIVRDELETSEMQQAKELMIALITAEKSLNNPFTTTQIAAVEKLKLASALSVYNNAKEQPEVVDKTVLRLVIDYAEEVKAEGALENVVPSVVTEFEAALQEAKAILADVNATEVQIDLAANRLINVIHMLEFKKGDKAELAKLVEIINALEENKYTASTWAALQAELAKANAVIADQNAMEAEVAKAYEDLNKEFSNLEMVVSTDKAKLQQLVTELEGKDTSKFTSGTVAKLNLELANAKAVLENKEATQEEVDKAVEGLELALNNLELAQANDNEKPVENPVNKDDNKNPGDVNNPEDIKNSPTTGDTSYVFLYVGFMIMACVALYILKKKNRYQNQ